jgi:hypothetical protein
VDLPDFEYEQMLVDDGDFDKWAKTFNFNIPCYTSIMLFLKLFRVLNSLCSTKNLLRFNFLHLFLRRL